MLKLPFCPNCKTEYREGFTHCADCGAPLVPALPPAPEAPEVPAYPSEPALLMHCPSSFEADATVALLQSFSIPCYTQPDMGAEKAYTGFCLTGGAIFVEKARLDEARDIVEGFRRGGGEIDAADRRRLLEEAKAAPPAQTGKSNGFVIARNAVAVLFLLYLFLMFLYFTSP